MRTKQSVGCVAVVLATMASVLSAAPVIKEEVREPAPVINYVVASPRACLMGVPLEEPVDEYPPMMGVAENFPRTGGTIEVPVGTRVIFSLSPDTEGLWFEGASGTIEVLLTLQWFRASNPLECVECLAEGLDDGRLPATIQGQAGSPEEVAPCSWITLGTDGSRDIRTGPSIGYTKVGIPVVFEEPGTYCVRGIVTTSVKTWYPRPQEPSQDRSTKEEQTPIELPPSLLALDMDIVRATVRVVDRVIPGTEPLEEVAEDPDVTYTRPMPNVADTKAASLDEDYLTNSGVFGVVDPGVFVGSRGHDFVIPSEPVDWQLKK